MAIAGSPRIKPFYRRLWKSWSNNLPPRQFALLRESQLIVPLCGDACTPETLGLPEEIISTLRETVSIVFNLASKIRLFDSLKETKLTNLDSAICVADVATSFKKLERFTWASSAYANSHLHWVDPQADTAIIKDMIYPPMGILNGDSIDISALDSNADPVQVAEGTDPEAELKELEEKGQTKAYLESFFPTGYSYIKNLTERLLLVRYAPRDTNTSSTHDSNVPGSVTTATMTSKAKLPHLLLFRPSIIGPALREPVPAFDILGSTPLSTLLSCMIYGARGGHASMNGMVWSLPTRNNRGLATLVDECPVDLVTNQLLVHTSLRTSGTVHTVTGRGMDGTSHEDTLLPFEAYYREYSIHVPYSQRPKFNWVDDRAVLERFKAAKLDGETYTEIQEREFGSVAKMWSSLGASYLWEDDKTQRVWKECMSEEDRKVLPLFVKSKNELLRALNLRKHRKMEEMGRELRESGMLQKEKEILDHQGKHAAIMSSS